MAVTSSVGGLPGSPDKYHVGASAATSWKRVLLKCDQLVLASGVPTTACVFIILLADAAFVGFACVGCFQPILSWNKSRKASDGQDRDDEHFGSGCSVPLFLSAVASSF